MVVGTCRGVARRKCSVICRRTGAATAAVVAVWEENSGDEDVIYPAYPEIVRLSAARYRQDLSTKLEGGEFPRVGAAVGRLVELLGAVATERPLVAGQLGFTASDLAGAIEDETQAL